MYELNEKIKDLIPYEPISGTYKIRLDANESYLRIPEYVMAESAAKLIKAQMNRYPDSTAAMLCKAFAVTYGVEVENVVAGNGSDELISLVFNGFLMRGERFATMNPDFSMYDFYGALSEGEKLTISKNPDFTISPEQVILACNSEKVRLLIFSNPCNPTSLGLVAEDVRRIIRGVPDTLVVVDEAYMDFWDQSLLPESANYDNLLILKTCSKAFGLAALRIGFAVGNPTLIRAIKAIKSPYNVNTVSQVMAETVLRHKGETKAALGQIIAAKNELYLFLKNLESQYPTKLQVLSGNTNFVVVRTEMAKEIWQYLLDIGIAIRCFDGFLRITAGSNNENCQLIKFLGDYLHKNCG